MKKIIVTISAATLIAGSVFTGCQTSEKKVDDAKKNVVEAKYELNQALKDSIQDFKSKSESRIADYEKAIVELKANIAKEKTENRSYYEKELAILEQKNKDLKIQLIDYKEENEEKWNSFKKEFNKDLNDLGQSFKNLMTKDKK